MIEIIQSSLFNQLAAILILTGITGFIFLKLKQPLIIAFIAVGLIVGEEALGIAGENNHTIETFAELGISLLLFMVGLKLDVNLLRTLGPSAAIIGVTQIILTTVLGAGIGLLCGLGMVESACLGIAMSFSSTIIVVKLLSDKRSINSLHGRIALGVLIVQDFAVILVMVAVSALGTGDIEASQNPQMMVIGLRLMFLLAFTTIVIRYLAIPLTNQLSKSSELLTIFSIAYAALLAAICYEWGLGRELGGLLAGVSLASAPARNTIVARLAPLRDFLLLFFFVHLGLQIDLHELGGQVKPALAFALFALLGKPLIIMPITGAMGHRKRTSFLAGVSLGQISEFSLIFIAMTAGAGIVSEDSLQLVTLTALISIGISTYVITYSGRLFRLCEPYLSFLERRIPTEKSDEDDQSVNQAFDVIVFGMGRYGTSLVRMLKAKGLKILAVDFDPQALKDAEKMDVKAIYGDAADAEFLKSLPLNKADTVIFSFQHYMTGPLLDDIRVTLARLLRESGYKGHIASTSHFRAEEKQLMAHGVDIVLCPYDDAAKTAAEQILAVDAKDDERKTEATT